MSKKKKKQFKEAQKLIVWQNLRKIRILFYGLLFFILLHAASIGVEISISKMYDKE